MAKINSVTDKIEVSLPEKVLFLFVENMLTTHKFLHDLGETPGDKVIRDHMSGSALEKALTWLENSYEHLALYTSGRVNTLTEEDCLVFGIIQQDYTIVLYEDSFRVTPVINLGIQKTISTLMDEPFDLETIDDCAACEKTECKGHALQLRQAVQDARKEFLSRLS